jgi:hypothetical protein
MCDWADNMDNLYTFVVATLSSIPLILAGAVVALHASGAKIDPFSPEEEKIIEAISKSRWAQELASAMATTPEAKERVARMLATQLYKTIMKTTA